MWVLCCQPEGLVRELRDFDIIVYSSPTSLESLKQAPKWYDWTDWYQDESRFR